MKKVNNSSQKITKTKSHPFWQWFWLTFLVVSLAYAWYSFYVPSNDIEWDYDITSVQQLTNDSGKNTLLFFTGKWCVPCRIMKREVFADKEVMKVTNSQVISVMIDIDNPNTKELVKHYKVGATPTTIIIDSKGKVLDYSVGKIGKKKFLEMLSTCNSYMKSGITQQPTLTDYQVGEKWVWKYKGVTTEGEVRSNGRDTRAIVSADGVLGMTIGKDTIPVTDIVKPDESETPKYDWPLEVGKKWKYENNWTSQDGTTGNQSQDVEILSFQKETVEAGTFMAYTIKYTGKITNSRGYGADEEEVWLYAPAIKNFIKLTQTQGDFLYVEELIEYSNPNLFSVKH